MKRSKFTEEQIIAILREQEAGAKTAEVCRRHGISGATFYAWKAKFGGMEPSEARRLKALEDENTKRDCSIPWGAYCRSGLYSLPVLAKERQDALENQY